jgi:hypothetical protein
LAIGLVGKSKSKPRAAIRSAGISTPLRQLAVRCSVERSNASISLIYQIFIGVNVFLLAAYLASAMRGEGGKK